MKRMFTVWVDTRDATEEVVQLPDISFFTEANARLRASGINSDPVNYPNMVAWVEEGTRQDFGFPSNKGPGHGLTQLTDDIKAAILGYHESGMGTSEISARTGIHRDIVLRVIKRRR